MAALRHYRLSRTVHEPRNLPPALKIDKSLSVMSDPGTSMCTLDLVPQVAYCTSRTLTVHRDVHTASFFSNSTMPVVHYSRTMPVVDPDSRTALYPVSSAASAHPLKIDKSLAHQCTAGTVPGYSCAAFPVGDPDLTRGAPTHSETLGSPSRISVFQTRRIPGGGIVE